MEYREIVERIEKLRGAGFTPERTITSTMSAVAAVQSPKDAVRRESDRLAAAIEIGNSGEATAAARALATVRSKEYAQCEQDAMHYGAEVIQAALVASDLERAWDTFKGVFDSTGQQFVALVQRVAPDAKPDEIIQDTEAINFWRAIPDVAATFDRDAEALITCIELAGMTFDRASAADWCALCVDMANANRTKVMQAWSATTESRGGRWTAILKLGGVPKAAGSVEEWDAARK